MDLDSQVLRAMERRETKFVSDVFDKFKEGSTEMIPRRKIKKAFSTFQICSADSVDHFLPQSEKFLKDSDGLTFDAFKEILETPSRLDQWTQSVQLYRLLAAAIPRKIGVSKPFAVRL